VDTKQPLAPRQRAVYEFIREHIRLRGYPPTMREIGAGTGIHSTNGVSCHLRDLVRKGWIERDCERARGMRVVGGE
jgi:repressor LexA